MSKVRLSALLLLLLFVATTSRAQTENLLQNPNADLETQRWRTMGQASVEESNGNRCFVVRNGGYFYQDMALPESAVGKYALLIGRGSSERINQDGVITGLPYLYAAPRSARGCLTTWTGAHQAEHSLTCSLLSMLLIIAAPGQLTLDRCVLDDQGNFIDVLFVISEKGDMLNALSAMWSRTNFRRNAVL